MAQDPGRVFPGKRMAGHLGDVQSTMQGLTLFALISSASFCWSRVPFLAAKGSDVVVRPAVKA
jgi:large subunit ribosomal protein L3